ncbi:AraC family transcriptional regulator [Paenibacillus sp. MBLB4367]|uniref:AraC family transcriptional regulator n=1 Tax=Paenibacillus sp. MBLB4367 TaxID=3384767 RepID=UPI00390825C1
MHTEGRPYLMIKSFSHPMFISAGKAVLSPGEKHVKRVFTTFVAMFIMEGKVYFTENGQEYELEKGEWFIQTPGLLHFGHQASSEKAVFYWVHFLPSGDWDIRFDAAKASGEYRLLNSGDGVRIPEYECSVAMRFPYFPMERWRLDLEELTSLKWNQNFLAAQSRWLKLLSEIQSMDTTDQVPAGHLLAERIYVHIQSHFRDSVTVERMSELFHFSPDYLSKCFRIKYGISPIGYIMQLRMEHVKKQIITTNLSIREIAAEVGYHDLSVFSRAFKNYQGVSPVTYKRNVIGSNTN